ncbi:hypothetical protein ACTMU2_12630 [Cupriavidus basilensis]
MFDALGEGCVILGADGRVVEYNPAAVRLVPELRRGQPVPPGWEEVLCARSGPAAKASHVRSFRPARISN